MFRRYCKCNKCDCQKKYYNNCNCNEFNKNANCNNCNQNYYYENSINSAKEYWDRSLGQNDITMDQLQQMVNQGALLVDIRSPQEYQEGHLEGSIVLPVYEIYKSAYRVIPNKNQPIIVYCGTGIRSKNALRILQKMGYTNVYNLYKGTENY